MARVFVRAGRGGYWVDDQTGEPIIGDGAPKVNPQTGQVVPDVPPAPTANPMGAPSGPTPPVLATPQADPQAAPQAPQSSPGVLSNTVAPGILEWGLQQQEAQQQAQQSADIEKQTGNLRRGEDYARNQALSSGLIGMGAGLLNYDARRGPASAFGAGLEGFNKAYDTELIANRPKVTPIAGGAFSQVVYPDGRIEVMENKEAQKYIQQTKQMEADILMGRDLRKGSIESIRNDLRQNKETQQKLNEQVSANEPQIQKLESALKVVQTMKPGENLLNLPGVNQVAQAFNIGGSDTLSKLKQLTEVKVDETLMNTARTKGAISNAEMDLFMKPIPSDYADPEVWKAWLSNRVTVLRKYNDFIKSQSAGLKTSMSEEDLRREVTGGAPSPTGKTAIAPSAIPGLSPGAAKYFGQ